MEHDSIVGNNLNQSGYPVARKKTENDRDQGKSNSRILWLEKPRIRQIEIAPNQI
jgi:hypothetical protein